MNQLLVSSDWHSDPRCCSLELSSHLKYIEHRLDLGWQIVLAGDLFKALEYGWHVYQSDPIINRIAHWSEFPNCIILKGNHDQDSPYFPQQQSIVFDSTYISHWDQFDLLWGWLPISQFPVPAFIQKWYRTPAKKKADGLNDWHISTLTCEYNATNFAIKNHYAVVVGGHTHSPVMTIREGITIANTGDFVDSFTWLEFDGKWHSHKLI